jgi:hypothetical protein
VKSKLRHKLREELKWKSKLGDFNGAKVTVAVEVVYMAFNKS